jgi:integral membrane protein (TIGR00529 family)
VAFGLGARDTIQKFYELSIAGETLKFVALVAMVHALSLTLKSGKQIERITESLRGFMPSRPFLVAALPSIVGLLPMPGGALFSAPMVEAAAGDTTLTGNDKTRANHWFRHIWEYTWPLYPGIILAADMISRKVEGITVGKLSVLHSPLTLSAVVLGTIFFLLRIPRESVVKDDEGPSRAWQGARFILEMAPFFIVVVTHIAFGVNLLVALGVGIVWSAGTNLIRRSARPAVLLKAVFANPKFYGFIVMAFGVKYFGGMLAKSGALAELGSFFAGAAIPAILLAIILPFITGMISGITIVYVSTAFPVLLAVQPIGADPIPYLVLAFASGFVGTLLSPIHACLVLGCSYFKGNLLKNILVMAVPSLGILATAVGLFFLYRVWMPF